MERNLAHFTRLIAIEKHISLLYIQRLVEIGLRSSVADAVENIPPTNRIVNWKETGDVKQLFAPDALPVTLEGNDIYEDIEYSNNNQAIVLNMEPEGAQQHGLPLDGIENVLGQNESIALPIDKESLTLNETEMDTEMSEQILSDSAIAVCIIHTYINYEVITSLLFYSFKITCIIFKYFNRNRVVNKDYF